MKKVVLATALTVVAGAAFAGGMSEPVMEPEIVMEVAEAAGTSGGIIVPLLILALIGLAAS